MGLHPLSEKMGGGTAALPPAPLLLTLVIAAWMESVHTRTSTHLTSSTNLFQMCSATNGTYQLASAIQAEAPKKQKLDQSLVLPPLSFDHCNNVVINIDTPSTTNN